MPPVLEVAILNIIRGQESAFEQAFVQAQSIISGMDGYLGHQLQRGVERPSQFILLVRWESLHAHTVGFRGSDEYQEWKRLLHHFYDPFPVVEHYELVAGDETL